MKTDELKMAKFLLKKQTLSDWRERRRMNRMTLGSLFDGIGGWPDAALLAGIKPLWASEIEPFPAAVTAHHYPGMKQLGDITKINVDELEPVDIICAGSPCQDLSVAGKRKGLEGERSGLFRTAIDIVHRLRERTGKPRFFVWENVPGAFSSNGGLILEPCLRKSDRPKFQCLTVTSGQQSRFTEMRQADYREGATMKVYDMTHADEVMRPVTGDKSNCLNSRMGTGGESSASDT